LRTIVDFLINCGFNFYFSGDFTVVLDFMRGLVLDIIGFVYEILTPIPDMKNSVCIYFLLIIVEVV
jgi:hypothetical protein